MSHALFNRVHPCYDMVDVHTLVSIHVVLEDNQVWTVGPGHKT